MILAPRPLRAGAVLLVVLLSASCASVPQSGGDEVGAEVGVAFDREGERGTHAQGYADPTARRLATPDDPVRIASVSKLVVAIGVMKLVEGGKLSLDEDASTYLGWPLRNPAFLDRSITLRMLLSHTASVRDYDDQYAIPLGGSLRAVLADPRSWDAEHAPGSGYFAYSNLNFPIIASVMERVTGERFDLWIRRDVLEPMKLDACFNWPTCSDAALARAVVLTQGGKPIRDDLRGRLPSCPVFVREGEPCDLSTWRPGENGALFSPQGGLRISGRDLARIGRMLLNGGKLDGVRILSPSSVALLLRPQWRYNGRNGSQEGESAGVCSYGLASQQLGSRVAGCRDSLRGDGRSWVGHAGSAYGLRSGLWIDPARGVGVAYFRTGLDDRSDTSSAEAGAFRRTLGLLKARPYSARRVQSTSER